MRLGFNISIGLPVGMRLAAVRPRLRSGLASLREAAATAAALRMRFRGIGSAQPQTSVPGEHVLPRPRNPFGWSRARKVVPETEPDASAAGAHLAQMPAPITWEQRLKEALRVALGWESIPDDLVLPASMLDDFLELDGRFAAAAHAGYSLERLMSVLCDHARIREYASGPRRTLAIDGLAALAGVLRESVEPGRDGYELNALVGLSNELDGAIKALRIRCVEHFMSRQSGRLAPFDLRATAAQHARELVEGEFVLAHARARLLRALDRSGAGRTLGGLAGLKVDAKLVIRLREQFGAKAQEVGLALAALLIAQRDVSALDAAARMRGDIEEELIWRDVMHGPHDHVNNADVRYLQQRLAALQGDIDPHKGVVQAGQSTDDACIALCGLTRGELDMLGLSLLDVTSTCAAIRQLARQGLSSASEASEAAARVRAVGQGWAANGGAQRLVGTGVAILGGAKNEDKARRLGDRLLQMLCGDWKLRLDDLQDKDTNALAAGKIRKMGLLTPPADFAAGLSGTADNYARHQLLLAEQASFLPWAQQNAHDEAVLVARITETKRMMDALLAHRRQMMGEEFALNVRRAVRTAMLLQLRGIGMHQLRPADHAEAIRKTLAGWGLDVQALAPEIDTQLELEFNLEAVALWVEEEGLVEERADQSDARQALMDSIDNLQLRTRLKVNWGGRVEGQTGAIPVDPSMMASVNVKAGAGWFSGIEIARTLDGGKDQLELQLRKGKDGKLGIEGSLRLWYASHFGLKAEAVASGESWGHAATGFALHFPADAAGRAALKELLARLLDDQPVTLSDLAKAESIMPLREDKGGAKVGVGARAGIDLGASEAAGWSEADHISVTASVKALLQKGAQRTHAVAGNNNMTVEKTDVEVSTEAAVVAAAGLRVDFTPGAKDAHGANGSAVEAGVTVASVVRHKKKVVRGADGLVQIGTERVAQKYAGRSGLNDLAALGGRAFTRQMELLHERDNEAAIAIETLAASAGTNDVLTVASTLRPRVAAKINAHLSQARALRSGRAGGGTESESAREAAAHERAAEALLDDPRAWRIARVSLIPSPEKIETMTQMNLFLIQKTSYVEEKGEFVAWEVKPDLNIAEEVCDELYGWSG